MLSAADADIRNRQLAWILFAAATISFGEVWGEAFLLIRV